MATTARPQLDERLGAPADAFEESRAMATLRALCAPELTGRAVGTPGHDRATELLIGAFGALGLETTRRTFPVPGVLRLGAPPVLTVDGPVSSRRLEHRRDYAAHPRSAPMDEAVEGRVARWDGTPRPGAWTALEGAPRAGDLARLAAAVRRGGGVGLLVAQLPDGSGFLTKRVTGVPVEVPVIAVRADLLADLLAGGDASTVRALVPLRRETVTATNVLALLPGADPALAARPVLLSAHYDGVGDDPDRRFPCAGDNASGTAVLLEVARTLTAHRFRPARPLMFAALDAEEAGSQGSRRHAEELLAAGLRPDVVNLDMAGKFNGAVAVDLGPGSRLIEDVLDRAGRALAVPLALAPVVSDNRRYAAAGLAVAGLGLGAAHYHSPLDAPDRIEPGALRRAGRLLLVSAALLALDPPPHHGT
ncbi:M28 family metallopeptidase [Streptosporangium sp. NPDC023963]|uniref:M28 family metallopeptidase n=1 Tax=Streptosporangium sp. NPDC023963 TaxID=3155608 RepID=UPI00341D8490